MSKTEVTLEVSNDNVFAVDGSAGVGKLETRRELGEDWSVAPC